MDEWMDGRIELRNGPLYGGVNIYNWAGRNANFEIEK